MKVTITIEIDTTTTPPLVSVTTNDEAPEPAQTSLEDFTGSHTQPDAERPHRDHNHMRRKFIYKCSICGKVGYNARSHPDHFSED